MGPHGRTEELPTDGPTASRATSRQSIRICGYPSASGYGAKYGLLYGLAGLRITANSDARSAICPKPRTTDSRQCRACGGPQVRAPTFPEVPGQPGSEWRGATTAERRGLSVLRRGRGRARQRCPAKGSLSGSDRGGVLAASWALPIELGARGLAKRRLRADFRPPRHKATLQNNPFREGPPATDQLQQSEAWDPREGEGAQFRIPDWRRNHRCSPQPEWRVPL